MKFVIAVVMLIAAIGAQAGYVSLPLAYQRSAVYPGTYYTRAAPAYTYAAPSYVRQIPAVVPYIAAAEATYVAKTPGSIHTATLPGHSESTLALNDVPALGTFY